MRADEVSGWIDTLQVEPAGPTQWSWKPVGLLSAGLTNFCTAISLSAHVTCWVGAYKFYPLKQRKLPTSPIWPVMVWLSTLSTTLLIAPGNSVLIAFCESSGRVDGASLCPRLNSVFLNRATLFQFCSRGQASH